MFVKWDARSFFDNGYEPIKWYISIIFSKKWLEVLLCIC